MRRKRRHPKHQVENLKIKLHINQDDLKDTGSDTDTLSREQMQNWEQKHEADRLRKSEGDTKT